jgi:hypothetical protein
MLKGSCLCGQVRYEYDGDITEVSMCHCSQCRKAQGTAYVAVSPVESSKLRLVAGADLLREYRTASKAEWEVIADGWPQYAGAK